MLHIVTSDYDFFSGVRWLFASKDISGAIWLHP